uniref:Uncharacterized protein n=1 Tax=Oryctolagus cuniculus TaxID=9986 RepID=A0A5F9C3U0_RABIT
MVPSPGGQLSRTWLPQDGQVGLPAGELRVGEHHDAVLGSFVEAKHSLLVGALTDGIHASDHLVPAPVVAALVVRLPRVKQAVGPLPLGAASIRAGGALLARLPKGSRLRALALPAEAVPALAADLPVFGPAHSTCAALSHVCWSVTAQQTPSVVLLGSP